MAKVSIRIDCTVCGKEFTHTKYCCNSREAKEYENWACDNITMCPDCYKMKKVEAVEFDDIVSLTGTDRQIEWARQIRAKIIVPIINRKWSIIRRYMSCLGYDDNAIKFWATEYEIADEQARINALKHLINSQTSAVWWIDNRDKFEL